MGASNENFARVVPDIILAGSLKEALHEADSSILQAEWPELSELGAEDFLEAMRTPFTMDGRLISDPAAMRGVRFQRIGWPLEICTCIC